MTEKHIKYAGFEMILNMIFIFISAVSDFVPVSAFASLVGVPVGMTSSAVGLKICGITSEIKKCKLIVKKKKEKSMIIWCY